jgi:hypothetical protein
VDDVQFVSRHFLSVDPDVLADEEDSLSGWALGVLDDHLGSVAVLRRLGCGFKVASASLGVIKCLFGGVEQNGEQLSVDLRVECVAFGVEMGVVALRS